MEFNVFIASLFTIRSHESRLNRFITSITDLLNPAGNLKGFSFLSHLILFMFYLKSKMHASSPMPMVL